MKKIAVIIAITLGVCTLAGYGTYKILGNVENYEKENNEDEVGAAAPPRDEDSPYETKEEEYKEQTKLMGGEMFDLKLNEDTTEGEVIEAMHKMTHQKIKAEDKWGAIPMSGTTVKQILDFLRTADFASKDDLIRIAEKWENQDFSTVDEDHNYFWEWQGGTVGKAYGIMNPAEEAEFIKNNF